MTTPTDHATAVAEALYNLLVANQASLGIMDVFYGDQDKIPRAPTVCVEPTTKNRVLAGVPRRTEVTIQVLLLLYHARVQDNQATRRETDLFAEAVEDLIHASDNITLGGLVIHGMVVSSEFGYAQRTNALWQGVRMTYEALTKVNLPYSAG